MSRSSSPAMSMRLTLTPLLATPRLEGACCSQSLFPDRPFVNQRLRGTPPGERPASAVGLLARGSVALAAFPGAPTQWLMAQARRLQLRGQPRIWVLARTAFPVRSHARDRRYPALNGANAPFVN